MIDVAGLTKAVAVVAITASALAQSTALVHAANQTYSAFVIDANNGKVLFSKFADDLRFPASLTKMMTLYMLFEALEGGRISLKTPMKVSAYAAARPPTKLRLKVGSTLTVEEAILGLVTLSANDASVVIAEHLGGSEERFASMMTAKAHQLGMSRTTFRNANGLPNPGQRTTARDMATLGIALREHFPREYGYFKTKSFNFRGRTIGSHNRLVGRIKGVDGIKTGYTNASGFNLVSSLQDNGRKIVGVVMGGNTAAARDKHMAELLTKYLASASSRGGEPLIAARRGTEPRVTFASAAAPADVVAAAPSYTAPTRVPLPRMRATIEDRIAEAYGSETGGAVAQISGSMDHPIVGRAALRAAMVPARRERPVPMSPVNALAIERPTPPGEIPGGSDYDPTTTGSVAEAATAPRSGWMVQIAAMPDRGRAMEMLAEAKQRGGAALSMAEPHTEAVGALYRARFAGFDSKNAANRACAVLKQRSYSCYTVAN